MDVRAAGLRKPGKRGLCLSLLMMALAGATPAGAEIGAIKPELSQATSRARDARGPEVYAELRGIWRMWDRADPAQVEEAVRSIAESKATSAPARAYAELLTAYARRRRGDLDGAVKTIERLGFLGQWMTLGPFDNDNKTGFTRAFPPETELLAPIEIGRSYDGKERPVRWRVPPEAPQYGWFDFGEFMRPRENVCAYATTFVEAKAGTRAPRKASLWMGSAGAFRVYWNGEIALEDTGYRDLDADRFAAMVTLAPGKNRVTVKVCGDAEAPKFALRLGDEKGAPDLGIVVTADPAASLVGAQTIDKGKRPGKAAKGAAPADDKAAKGAKAAPAIPIKAAIEGPIQTFERETADPKVSPQKLEDYARYLATTGGDSAPEHKARDLARRAAEAEPTVKRMLLAGQLAEDRNQQREWADKAAALAGPDHPDLEVLLMQAQLAREGTNWRDAVPIYQKMLALDPDDISATLGLVELYVEAGLRRTAVTTLEKAMARQPNSVALLRVYAAELRSLGRDTEAAEAEGRYAALRFDDSAFLSQQVELAVARRDTAGAERWLERFLRAEPESAWSRSVAARTYRALGQGDRALAAYQRALLLAPEDVGTLRALSDLYGAEDKREEQLRLLRQILAIAPQAKDVREYVEHIEPPRPRADEAYAWAKEVFLPMRAGANKRYPKRTLRNLTVTTVFPNGLASRFKQVVFQPLTDEAAAAAREYAFDYQGDRQTVTLRAARVYRADGKVDEAVESGEGGANNPAIAMYTSTRAFYVHFPRLNTGDVVELRYRVEDVAPRNELADYFGEVEYLGSDEPIDSSEYVLITPKARSFHVNASSVPGLKRETKEEGELRIDRFSVEKLEPIVVEPVMPPWAEVLPHVHVSTFKTWDEVGVWYWGLAREQFDVDDEVRKKVKEVTKGLTDDAARVRAVYRFATEARYVALEFGLEGIRPRRCAQTLARGWGDCKDKATLIVTMLRELGIPATIVLVRTGMRGGIEPEPASLAPFDHAIAYVPSLDLYLDGTAEHTGSTELPVMDRDAIALQVNEGKAKLVHLPQPPPEASLSRRKIDVTLAPDGTGQFSFDLSVSGAYAPTFRERYLAEGTRRDRSARDIGREIGSIELLQGKGGVEVNDLDDEEQPVKLRAKGKTLTFARREGDALSVPAGPAHELVADYASLSKRTLDINLRALTMREDEWVVHLPAGMKVTRPATAATLDSPFGRFSFTFEESQGKVTVKTVLAFKKARITPAEYPAWRAFCEAADRAFGQRFVVGK
jgi:tetratricopeptide (TPR) repeat protein/transglutaminase-like putative cysteine protease